jgi:hypothetical protein
MGNEREKGDETRLLVARSPLMAFRDGRDEEVDTASGHLPCTGRQDGGTMVRSDFFWSVFTM